MNQAKGARESLELGKGPGTFYILVKEGLTDEVTFE